MNQFKSFKIKNNEKKLDKVMILLEKINNLKIENKKIEKDIKKEQLVNQNMLKDFNSKNNFLIFTNNTKKQENQIKNNKFSSYNHKRTKSDLEFYNIINKEYEEKNLKNKIQILFKNKQGHGSRKNKNSKRIILNNNFNFFKFNKENINLKIINEPYKNFEWENDHSSLSKITEKSISNNFNYNNKKNLIQINIDEIKNLNNNNYYDNSPISSKYSNYYNNTICNNYKKKIKSNKMINYKSSPFNLKVKKSINHHLDSINDVKFLDENHIISCSSDYLIKIYDINNKKSKIFRHSLSQIFSLDYNVFNNKVIFGNSNGSLQIFNYKLNNLKFIKKQIIKSNYPINQIISLNNNYLVSNSINLYFTNNLSKNFKKINKTVLDKIVIEYMENNEVILGNGNNFGVFNLEYINNKFNFFDLKNEENIVKIKKLGNKRILIGREKGFINIFDKNQLNKEIINFKAHEDDITSFILNEKENILGTTSHDCKIRFWDLRNYKILSDNWVI